MAWCVNFLFCIFPISFVTLFEWKENKMPFKNIENVIHKDLLLVLSITSSGLCLKYNSRQMQQTKNVLF